MAAADGPGELVFYRVPGTGLGTLDEGRPQAARARGFEVEQVAGRHRHASTRSCESHGLRDVHFMSDRCRGCGIRCPARTFAVASSDRGSSASRRSSPGTTTPSHQEWEPRTPRARLPVRRLRRREPLVRRGRARGPGATPSRSRSTPSTRASTAGCSPTRREQRRAPTGPAIRRAWQRELILNDIRGEVPKEEYEKQIARAAHRADPGRGLADLAATRARWPGSARRSLHRTRRSLPACPLRFSGAACVGSTSSTSP